MNYERLLCYIQGGRFESMPKIYSGCRDTTPPRDSVGYVMNAHLYFALHSHIWGGGMAFVGLQKIGKTYARNYLITLEQFTDIAAQEAGLSSGAVELDYSNLTVGSNVLVKDVLSREKLDVNVGYSISSYNCVHVLDRKDTIPVVTFSSSLEHSILTKPSLSYLKTIVEGIVASHDLENDQIVSYIKSAAGCEGLENYYIENLVCNARKSQKA